MWGFWSKVFSTRITRMLRNTDLKGFLLLDLLLLGKHYNVQISQNYGFKEMNVFVDKKSS
jgi:hypothetical protein